MIDGQRSFWFSEVNHSKGISSRIEICGQLEELVVMAALSLMCGDCGHQLRSVQEAQEHAKLTGHAKFFESTEAVLNLVCTAYGKPYRSKTKMWKPKKDVAEDRGLGARGAGWG